MAKKKQTKKAKPPAEQAKKNHPPGASPINGVVPPAEHRFPPGVSGNPDGRPTAGATIKEWMNQITHQNLSEVQVRVIARDKQEPLPKRTAAEQLLLMVERGDLADFEEWLEGTKTLAELRTAGFNTEVVKRATVSQEGIRTIQLHDRAGEAVDRVMDRTEGRPTQELKVSDTTPPDLMSDQRYVNLMLKMKTPHDRWAPGVLARYLAGKIPGYPMKEKK